LSKNVSDVIVEKQTTASLQTESDTDSCQVLTYTGALTLDMNRFPRGAKSSKLCTLDMLKTDGTVPQMSLFKHKRVKGWWPFHVKNEGEAMELTVKSDAVCHASSRPT